MNYNMADHKMGKHQGMVEGRASRLAIRTVHTWGEEMEDLHHRMATWDLRQTGDLHLLGPCGNLSHAIRQVKAMQLRRNKLSNMLG
jgi:hypothetical protein